MRLTAEERRMQNLLHDSVRAGIRVHFTPQQLAVIASIRRKANLERYGKADAHEVPSSQC